MPQRKRMQRWTKQWTEELEPQAASTPVQQAPAISRQKFLREIFIVCFLLWYQKTYSYNEKGDPTPCRAALP